MSWAEEPIWWECGERASEVGWQEAAALWRSGQGGPGQSGRGHDQCGCAVALSGSPIRFLVSTVEAVGAVGAIWRDSRTV